MTHRNVLLYPALLLFLFLFSCSNNSDDEKTDTDAVTVEAPTEPAANAVEEGGAGQRPGASGPQTDTAPPMVGTPGPGISPVVLPGQTLEEPLPRNATLAYSYFDSISEQETRYIWASLRIEASAQEARTELIDHMQHVVAQTLTASDTNSIKAIFIKGYRYVTLTADPSPDVAIVLEDGPARQELDTVNGNNWRWAVSVKPGTRPQNTRITLRIKATEGAEGMQDFEDEQIIRIGVSILDKKYNNPVSPHHDDKKGWKTSSWITLGVSILALILVLYVLLRKRVKQWTNRERKPKIFFSYAWGQQREVFVDKLYDSLHADGYHVIRDKVSLGYKGVISTFMQSIGKGEFIVVAISDKYLTSEFCMFELFEIFRNARMEKESLLQRIYPVCVENLNLKDPAVLQRYLQFWEQREQEWEHMIAANPDSVSEEQQAQHTRIKRIMAYLGTLLDLLSDINFLDMEKLSDNNFQQIKTAIQRRIEENDPGS